MTLAILLATCYLIGSIPFGYLAGRIAGIDIRKSGSGNIGATNVTRTLGKAYGYPVFALDFLKGVAAVRLSILVSDRGSLTVISPELMAIAAAIVCVMGHLFPLWLGFRGGKGVATSAGALFGLMPIALVIGAVVWMLTFLLSRYVSLASILTAVALPITILVLISLGHPGSYALFYFALCLSALVISRHRSNLSRLIHGTEPRFTRK